MTNGRGYSRHCAGRNETPPHEGLVVLVPLSAMLFHLHFAEDASIVPEDAFCNIRRKNHPKSYMRGEIFFVATEVGDLVEPIKVELSFNILSVQKMFVFLQPKRTIHHRVSICAYN